MEWMKNWLLAVTCAAVVVALADVLSPKGTPKKMVRLAGGLLLLLAVLSPVRQLENADLAGLLAQYRSQYSVYEEAAAVNSDVMKSIIEEETSAYILDKATGLGIAPCVVEVSCHMDEGSFPVPEQVTVRGQGEERAWSELSRAIAADFAIGPENQTFERTDVP